jgi:hypothetical protein
MLVNALETYRVIDQSAVPGTPNLRFVTASAKLNPSYNNLKSSFSTVCHVYVLFEEESTGTIPVDTKDIMNLESSLTLDYSVRDIDPYVTIANRTT